MLRRPRHDGQWHEEPPTARASGVTTAQDRAAPRVAYLECSNSVIKVVIEVVIEVEFLRRKQRSPFTFDRGFVLTKEL